MSTQRQDMAKATDEQVIKLAHIRGCSKLDAARAVAQTYAENLSLSRGTTMEGYWRLMVEVAEGQVATELGMVEQRPPDRNPGAAA